MFNKNRNTIINTCVLVITFWLLFYILKVLSNLIVPLIIAILFSFAIIWVSNFYQKFIKINFISFLLSLLTYSIIFWLIWKMIWTNVEDLIRLLPEYQNKILSILNKIFEILNMKPPTSINQIVQKLDLQYIVSSIIWAITLIFSKTWIILLELSCNLIWILLTTPTKLEFLKSLFIW